MVSQDGGVPLMRKSWEGNAADTQIFQERAHALLATWQGAPSPRSLVADAKLSTAEHATTLATLGCIPRMPGPRKLVAQVITPALPWDTWQCLDAPTRSQRLSLCPYGMAQRWLVGWSQASRERAEARVKQAWQRAAEAVQKHLFHWQAQRFEPPSQAPQALAELAHPWRYPQGQS